MIFFFFSSRRRHTRYWRDWSSDVCSSDLIPHADRAAADSTVVFTYVFMWEHGTVEEDLYQHKGRAAIALGFTSLLNHSYTPNCEFIRHIDDLVIDLLALRDIEEIGRAHV